MPTPGPSPGRPRTGLHYGVKGKKQLLGGEDHAPKSSRRMLCRPDNRFYCNTARCVSAVTIPILTRGPGTQRRAWDKDSAVCIGDRDREGRR